MARFPPLKNLLKPNPRNKFLEVTDDLITPSDIDVELPKGQSNYFDCQKFIKEMNEQYIPNHKFEGEKPKIQYYLKNKLLSRKGNFKK